MYRRLLTTILLGALAGLGMLSSGCGDSAITGDRVPNYPPETEVTATPPVLSQASYTVSFFWTGSDRDGQVVGFEWRISDNGPDGAVDIGDTLEANLPWQFTTRTDSIFVVSADLDSFEIDVEDPRQGSKDYRFWQTHTLFIRAIDEDGRVDPTPAHVSFTATTLAPSVLIDVPVYVPFNSCVDAAQVLTFGWTGEDPDNPEGDPAEVRYLLMPWGGAEDNCLTETQYRSLSPIRNDDPGWSEWIAYDAAQDSGRAVTLPRQDVGGSFLFAVQVRDVAGAVTPTFEWGRNVRHVRIGTSKFPQLSVSETFLGTFSFVSTNGLKTFDIVENQPLTFEWSADASSYAGIVEAFRYGWNIVDPNDPNDPGWAVAWGNGPNWRRAQPRSFSQGSPNFVVQCRDNSGTITRAFYQFQVIQIAERANQRNLLLIDDWRNEATPDGQGRDQAWDREWDDLLAGVQGFQNSDVIDAQRAADRLSFATVNEYKSVIWFTNASDQSFFHTRLAPQGRLAPRYNWLEVYQARVGNILFTGPGCMYNTFERQPPNWSFPIIFNVRVSGEVGFGTDERPDGTEFNVGTIRWPYSGWCLESTDIIRPAFTRIFQEAAGRPIREYNCDGLERALVSSDFYANYPDAEFEVVNLEPKVERTSKDPNYGLLFEEFYNRNVTAREVTLVLRQCQTTMFTHRARRDEGLVPNAQVVCPPLGASVSPLDGAPVGVVSRVYSSSKQLRGSEDFVWGFHPLAFQRSGVRRAILWILESRWELPVQGN
jgi:hypothetical protein